MKGFKQFCREIDELPNTGLISGRRVNNETPPNRPLQVTGTNNSVDYFTRKAGQLAVAGLGGAAIQTLVDAGKTLLHMGLGGNSWVNPAKAALGLAQLASPAITYAALTALGVDQAGLAALITSPQFWKAYRNAGRLYASENIDNDMKTFEQFVAEQANPVNEDGPFTWLGSKADAGVAKAYQGVKSGIRSGLQGVGLMNRSATERYQYDLNLFQQVAADMQSNAGQKLALQAAKEMQSWITTAKQRENGQGQIVRRRAAMKA